MNYFNHICISLANFNTVLPLSYFNRIAACMGPIEEAPSYGSVSGAFFNPDIVNPNSHNRQNAWPITIRSNMKKEEQVWDIIHSLTKYAVIFISLNKPAVMSKSA